MKRKASACAVIDAFIQEYTQLSKRFKMDPQSKRDDMNNEVSSTSSTEHPPKKLNKVYNKNYDNSSDTEVREKKLQPRSHFKSMSNLSEYKENIPTSITNVDVSLHNNEIKKFESLQIPIVGYEVMEERARFTIYKLKVEDDKRDQSWLVFRRYTDFVRLFSRLKNEQPSLLLPLPGKRWFRDNFEPAFLEERVRGLQVFVNAVISKIPNHPVVREFFCLDDPPQVFSYQPEVQAVYGALEDSIAALKIHVKQRDLRIAELQRKIAELEDERANCQCNRRVINN